MSYIYWEQVKVGAKMAQSVEKLVYGLKDRDSVPEIISPHHRVQKDSEPHPLSYPMGTEGC